MLSKIRGWLGITALQSRIAELELENEALRTGTVIVTPDGQLAKAEPPPMVPIRSRIRSFSQYARQREAKAWRDLCQEAFPNANSSTKRPD